MSVPGCKFLIAASLWPARGLLTSIPSSMEDDIHNVRPVTGGWRACRPFSHGGSRLRFNQTNGFSVKTYRIAAIPGDGIGSEVISAGVEALNACAKRDGGFAFAFDHFDWGSERYKKTGAFMPDNGRDLIRKHDAILFGSAGVPDVPDHVTLWGLRLAICQPFDQYANVRPTRILPGIVSPLRNVSGPELDWVIVRENSEGEYAGVGGRVHRGLPEEAAHRCVDVHPRGRGAHHALCVRAGAVTAAQISDRRD